MNKARVIAFYLPQYHPTPDNDKWWGKGFTEWTNVGKAKPLFPGHNQPKVPADLGYYDLRLPEVREQQAELAREAGIEGFCYYHYWFGNGKRELERPFNEVLASGKPDFPFMLCWANESWHRKFWNKDGSYSSKMLVKQLYGKEDYIRHFYEVLPAFLDKRYIRYKNRPIFMIYRPSDIPDVAAFIQLWNQLAKQNGLDGICFCAQTVKRNDIDTILSQGFDFVNLVRLWDLYREKNHNSIVKHAFSVLKTKLKSGPFIDSYSTAIDYFNGDEDYREEVIPTIIPNWDHTPRSGAGGYVLQGSTPNLFSKHIEKTLDIIKDKPEESRFVFIKSWNEWGEGNYMEPDIEFGRGYIDAFRAALDKFKQQ